MTTYLIVLCGAADRPVASLRDRTPLEAAATPHLDRLASSAQLGMLTIIDQEIAPESDSGIMSLLGYDPHRYYTGRGALEALGMDFMRAGENAVGFRINFASYDGDAGRLDRRTARDLDDRELQSLVVAIQSKLSASELGVNVELVGFGRHRGILCVSGGPGLSANVSNTDPGFCKRGPFGVPNDRFEPRPLPCLPLDDTAAAAYTAQLVNRLDTLIGTVLDQHPVNLARRAAGRHPANRILFRDAGATLPNMQSFSQRYGRSLAIYGQVPAERGLCKLLGGAWRDARQSAGVAAAEYYASLLNQVVRDPADVIVIHLKGPDEPGHDGNPTGKCQALEEIDDLFVGPFCGRVAADDAILVACDHATPCELGIHAADRVPVLVRTRASQRRKQRYCERDARAGTLPVSKAPELLDYVLAGSA